MLSCIVGVTAVLDSQVGETEDRFERGGQSERLFLELTKPLIKNGREIVLPLLLSWQSSRHTLAGIASTITLRLFTPHFITLETTG